MWSCGSGGENPPPTWSLVDTTGAINNAVARRRMAYQELMHAREGERKRAFSMHGWFGFSLDSEAKSNKESIKSNLQQQHLSIQRVTQMKSGDDNRENNPNPMFATEDRTIHDAMWKMPIPVGCLGYYNSFCPSEKWSSAFSSPGDFTVKITGVQCNGTEVVYRLSVICTWLKEGERITRGKEIRRLLEYVRTIHRKEREFKHLADVLTLKYPGHYLNSMLPQQLNAIMTATTSKHVLDERRYSMLRFISRVLQIQVAGHNQLIPLTNSILKEPEVASFLDIGSCVDVLPSWCASTTSCAARIERQRPSFPENWFRIHGYQGEKPTGGGGGVVIRRRSMYPEIELNTPRIIYSSNSEPTFESIDEPNHGGDEEEKQGKDEAAAAESLTKYRSPEEWKHTGLTRTTHASMVSSSSNDFTVEISNIAVENNRATYSIRVLSFTEEGQSKYHEVSRSYTDFYNLALHLDRKFSHLQLMSRMPKRTFFRCTEASFLEERSVELQRLLEFILSRHFFGLLGQKIDLCAEPTLREFLNLPRIRWKLVPKHAKPFRSERSFTLLPKHALYHPEVEHERKHQVQSDDHPVALTKSSFSLLFHTRRDEKQHDQLIRRSSGSF